MIDRITDTDTDTDVVLLDHNAAPVQTTSSQDGAAALLANAESLARSEVYRAERSLAVSRASAQLASACRKLVSLGAISPTDASDVLVLLAIARGEN